MKKYFVSIHDAKEWVHDLMNNRRERRRQTNIKKKHVRTERNGRLKWRIFYTFETSSKQKKTANLDARQMLV